jgi:hypothetical protein
MYYPAETEPAAIGAASIIGVRSAELMSRDLSPLRRRLQAGGAHDRVAVLLEDTTPRDLKTGRPYQRLSQLREQKLAALIFLRAADVPSAQWMVENTPAAAVIIPYGLADLTAQYALLDLAAASGTALIVDAPSQAIWTIPPAHSEVTNLGYCLAEPRLAAVIEPLPPTLAKLHARLQTMDHPVSCEDQAAVWDSFQQNVQRPNAPLHEGAPESVA